MASDSSSATIPDKSLENKVNEEAKLMEKETGKPVLDSNTGVTKEEEIDQTHAGEPEKESLIVVEGSVVKAEESIETEKHGNGEKGDEEFELKEPILVKESVGEVNVEAGDVEKAEKKPTVDGKQVEPVDVQSVRDVSAETVEERIKDVETLEVEVKPEVSEKVETRPETEIEVVKAEDTPETTEQAKVELQEKLEDITVEAKESGINSKDEKTSESGSVLCPEEVVLTKQESDIEPQKEVEEEVSCPADVIEKAITEEKHVVDEPSKDEKTLCPEEILSTKNEESDTGPKDETEGDVSSPGVIEKAITEEKHVVDEPSKDEKTSEPGAALCQVVPSNQESDSNPKEEIEGGASSPVDVIEKTITEEKHEPSKDETASALYPEKVVQSNQESETNPKEEIEGDASSPVDVTEKAITEEKHEPSKDETASVLCPEKVVVSNQDSETNSKEQTKGDASSPDDVIEKAITVVDEPSKDEKPSESSPALCPNNVEKESEGDDSSLAENAITEEKHVVEEPSKEEQETVTEAKDVITKLTTEGENIKKDTEPPATDTESGEKETAATKQEETITEKEAEVIETDPVGKESDEPKEQPEVTVPVKQKHSNSIISKVKQSLVKAKKAIIGKSPSSKTITTEEAKEEVKVK